MRMHPHRGLSLAIAMIRATSSGSRGGRPVFVCLNVHFRATSSPAKDGLRGHDEAGPAIPGHEPSEGGEEHPVETAKLRPPRLPLHHRELMAENEDLGLAPASIALRRDPKGEAKDEVDDREEHRRILLAAAHTANPEFVTPTGVARNSSPRSADGVAFWGDGSHRKPPRPAAHRGRPARRRRRVPPRDRAVPVRAHAHSYRMLAW